MKASDVPASRYRATMTQAPDFAYRLCAERFAAASRLFDRTTRERVWLLYAWCRACDDMADAQELGGQLGDQSGTPGAVLALREMTARAMSGEVTGSPAFDALIVITRETAIDTAMTEALSDAQKEKLLTAVPAGRLGTPEDIAASVVYLASQEASYVTGATIHVNGGMAML